MKHIFDDDDEWAIIDGLARNMFKADLIRETCTQRGQRRQAANWAKLARRISQRIILLEGAFRHKN